MLYKFSNSFVVSNRLFFIFFIFIFPLRQFLCFLHWYKDSSSEIRCNCLHNELLRIQLCFSCGPLAHGGGSECPYPIRAPTLQSEGTETSFWVLSSFGLIFLIIPPWLTFGRTAFVSWAWVKHS